MASLNGKRVESRVITSRREGVYPPEKGAPQVQ